MARFNWTLLIAGFALALTACGQQGGFKAEAVGAPLSTSAKTLNYTLESCDFFPTFETQAQMCAALQDDAFNKNCEPETREEIFKEQCPGDFRPTTLEDLEPLGFGQTPAPETSTPATPKPQTPSAPAPTPKPTPVIPATPTLPTPAEPSKNDGSTTTSPEVTVPTPPTGTTGPAPTTPSPKPTEPAKPSVPPVKPEPDLSAVITTSNIKDGDLTRLVIQRKDLDPAVLEVGCSKSLTVAMDRVESIVLVPGAQAFVALKKSEKSKFVGKVAACKGTIDEAAVKTPESNQKVERKILAAGETVAVRLMEGYKMEFTCLKDKSTALTSSKTGIALIAGSNVLVKTGDGESVPLRVYQCAN